MRRVEPLVHSAVGPTAVSSFWPMAACPQDDRCLVALRPMLGIGYLPDCEGPSRPAMLSGMNRAFPPVRSRLVPFDRRSARPVGTRHCGVVSLHARRDRAAAPRAAAGHRRGGRRARRHRVGRVHRPSRAVQSVAVRPRVSGLISAVSFEEGSLVRQGQLLFQVDPRPFQARWIGCAPSSRRRPPHAIAPRPRCGAPIGSSADNAMSLEERERRASAAAETTAHVDAVAAALRAAAARSGVHARRRADRRPRRAGRSSLEGNLVSGGQGEATLLTTVVSVDPIYASFDADEQTFLRYGDRARQHARAARAACRSRWRWPTNRRSRMRARCSSWTTSSIPRPARSTAAPSSATATAA